MCLPVLLLCEGKKGKGRWEPYVRATGRHLPYGITQCYLPPDTSERAAPNPSHAGWYSIYLPRRDGRLSWPSWLDFVLLTVYFFSYWFYGKERYMVRLIEQMIGHPRGHCEICTGGTVPFGVERAVYSQRRSVLDATSRRSTTRSRRTSRQSDGRWPSRRLHGSHPRVPGARREIEGTQGRLGWVQLPQGHRSLQFRF